MKYSLIDHTADFGIHVFGTDLKGLFENAAYALFDLMTDIKTVEGKQNLEVNIQGEDLPDLMVNWLREILFIWTGNEKIVKSADIHSISDTALSAKIFVADYSPGVHTIKHEIKAVTYHQITVERTENRWEAQIIFDV